MAFVSELVSFTFPITTTGNLVVNHNLGVKPEGYIFLGGGEDPEASDQGGLGMGFASDESNQRQGGTAFDCENNTTVNATRVVGEGAWSSSFCYVSLNGNSSSSVDSQLRMVSATSTTFTVNRVIAPSVARTVWVLVFAGAEVAVGTFTGNNTTSTQVVTHGLSSTPKALIMLKAGGAGSLNTVTGSMAFGLGVTDQDRNSRAFGMFSADNTSNDGWLVWRDAALVGVSGTGSVISYGDVTAWDADDFTITWGEANVDHVVFMAIGGADIITELVNNTVPTSGTKEITLANGGKAQAVITGSLGKTVDTDAVYNDSEVMQVGIGSDDGVTPLAVSHANWIDANGTTQNQAHDERGIDTFFHLTDTNGAENNVVDLETAGGEAKLKLSDVSSSTAYRFFALVIGEASAVTVQKALSGVSSSSGALSKKVIIDKLLSGASSNVGDLTTKVLSVVSKLLSGQADSSGIVTTETVQRKTLTGQSTNIGALSKKLSKEISGQSNSSGALSSKSITLFKLATQYAVPGDIKPYPVTFLEIGDLSGVPVNEPTPGQYLKGLKKHPELVTETTETLFGIRTFSDIQIELSNEGDILNFDNDLRDLDARVIRQEVGGAYSKIYIGKLGGYGYGQSPSLRLKNSFRKALREIFPRNIVDTTTYPKARDAGAYIPIAFGRNSRMGPLPYIEHDDINDVYRYACGQGKGFNNNFFKEVTTAYHEEVAFKTTTGTVVSGSSNKARIASNDQAPNDFYKDQWITIDSQTPKLITTSDEVTEVTIDGTFDVAPTGGEDYVIRPFRFYDGSQLTPYPGLAFIEFAFPIEEGSTFESIYIDCDALQEERNLIRLIQSLLSDPSWGSGLPLDTTAFDTMAGLTDITNMLIEGRIFKPEQLFDILSELFSYRNIDLDETEDGISILVETLRATPDAFYDLGIKKRENIKKGTLTNVNFVDSDKITKSLTALFRYDDFLDDYIHKDLKRTANSIGVDREYPINYAYEPETVDRILDFARKFEIAKAREWNFQGEKQGTLKKNYRINANISIDGMTIDSDWRIKQLIEGKTSIHLFLNPYPVDAFTYEASGSLPPPGSFPVPAKLEATPPNPLANVTLSYITDVDETDTPQTFAVFDYDIPEQNFDEARVILRENGQTVWLTGNSGDQQVRVPITPGISYDYQIAPYNSNGINGIAQTFINQLAPGDNTAPNAPTGLTAQGNMLGILEWAFTESTSTDVKEYEYQIDDFSSFASPLHTGRTKDNIIQWKGKDGGGLASGVTRWCRVRAIDRSKNPSSWTTGISNTTAGVVQGDIPTNEIVELGSYANDTSLTGAGINIASVTVTTRNKPVDITVSFVVKGAVAAFTFSLTRNTTVGLMSGTEAFAGAGFYSISHRDSSPGTGSSTYVLTATVSPNPGVAFRRMVVNEQRNG